MKSKKAFLVLENGRVFEGEGSGCEKDSIGELVFTTGVCGYTQTLSSPLCYGQIVLATFPLEGNSGVAEEQIDLESTARGFVSRELCVLPSNFRASFTLNDYLVKHGIPAVTGIDTREITHILTSEGTMNAGIFFGEAPADLSAIKEYKVSGAVEECSCTSEYTVNAHGKALYKIAVIDYGCGEELANTLADFGCEATVMPYNTPASRVLNAGFDAVALSDGGGSPLGCNELTGNVGELFGKLPMLGIGLGHQLIALSQGARCVKLSHGHRGSNHPVLCPENGRTYITSQYHGYTVDASTVKNGTVTLTNANDSSCEGIVYKDYNALSVQFMPCTEPGAQDMSFIFTGLLKLIGGND